MNLSETSNTGFRLQFRGGPLWEELAAYRPYHRDDMADALAAAYCLHKDGKNPVEALTADHCYYWGGILTWVDLAEFRRNSAEGRSLDSRASFTQFHREGDRRVRSSLPTLPGHMLVRGDRLVWKAEGLQMCVPPATRLGRQRTPSLSVWAETRPKSLTVKGLK